MFFGQKKAFKGQIIKSKKSKIILKWIFEAQGVIEQKIYKMKKIGHPQIMWDGSGQILILRSF